jgi:hypothetical protein
MKLCESAQKGRRCVDDLCRGADVTLCGFDEELWDDITSDGQDFDPRDEEEAAFDRAVEASGKWYDEQRSQNADKWSREGY